MKLKHMNPAVYVGLLPAIGLTAALTFSPAAIYADDATAVDQAAGAVEVTDRSNHADGWSNETGSWQYWQNGRVRKSAWIVTGVQPGATSETGLERYWIDAEGNLAVGRLIDPESNLDRAAGYYAYATDGGAVVRGIWTNDIEGSEDKGNVYLADNDGRLEDTGWLVTDDYGQGLQRYYIDSDEHAAVPGYSEDGWDHYTRPEGYVVRGKWDTGAGTVVLADNDGRTADGSGWLVTGIYDGGELQRYYLNGEGAARSSYFTDPATGQLYFGLGGEGYVLRGAGIGVDGARLYADNDGRLATSEWVVTDDFGQGFQRYWFADDSRMARGRMVTPDEGSGWLAYATDDGYVLRGASDEGGVKRYADNDGRLSDGWVITGAFTNGALERYWQEDGEFVTDRLIDAGGGWFAYAKDSGAVVRGSYTTNGKTYLANNDGRLENPGWLITDEYGDGLQRYYIDSEEHAAVEGFSNEGWPHYTTSNGTVLRGAMTTSNGILIADNDGRLLEATHEAGWADDYYLVEASDGHLYAASGFFEASLNGGTYTFYADTATGKVLRGKRSTGNGVLVADENGILAENYTGAGWFVTDRFDGGANRYYFQSINGHLYARTGLFEEDSLSKPGERRHYYGLADEGYVLINGTRVVNGTTYRANGHGELTAVASRTRDPYINVVTWSGDWGYLDEMRQYANQYGSPTDFFIVVDYDLCRVIIFQRSGSAWNAVKTWNCNAGTNTFGGLWHVVHRNICMWDDSYFNRMDNNWATCFVEAYSPTNYLGHQRYYPGRGYEDCQAFHSSSYTTTGYKNPGCVSVPEVNAKWIYDNVPDGTSVYVLK